MDKATVIGIVAGVILVSSAIILGGNPQIFVNVQGILIVLGGTLATTLIRFPLVRVLKMFGVVKNAFSVRLQTPDQVIEELIQLCRQSRKDGILSLEGYESEDPFLEQGLQLIVDGNEVDAVQRVLATDIKYLKQRHGDGRDILKAIGDAAPAFGMIGTLIGLVIMLTTLDDPKSLGPAMAVAILTTLYGALIANLVALPIAKKLEIRSKEESLNRELMMVGLMHILKGENPRMMETVLRAFLSNREPQVDEKSQTPKAA